MEAGGEGRREKKEEERQGKGNPSAVGVKEGRRRRSSRVSASEAVAPAYRFLGWVWWCGGAVRRVGDGGREATATMEWVARKERLLDW